MAAFVREVVSVILGIRRLSREEHTAAEFVAILRLVVSHSQVYFECLAYAEFTYQILAAQTCLNRAVALQSDVVSGNAHFLVQRVLDVYLESAIAHLLIHWYLPDTLLYELSDDKRIVAGVFNHVQLVTPHFVEQHSSIQINYGQGTLHFALKVPRGYFGLHILIYSV